MPGFTLNSAVDELLKKEFDIHRAKREAHPLMKAYGVKAVPFEYEKMDEWRDALRGGVTYVHPETNLLLTGGVDDVWVDEEGKLIVVDYKATSTRQEITLEGEYKEGYKRQMEFYQWLLRKNGFNVSDTGYFVYVNADKDKAAFDARLEFDVKLISHEGNDDWVEPTVVKAYETLVSGEQPETSADCEYCGYREEFGKLEK
jgi:RecB family exonuclease